jgi:hypothetical protein
VVNDEHEKEKDILDVDTSQGMSIGEREYPLIRLESKLEPKSVPPITDKICYQQVMSNLNTPKCKPHFLRQEDDIKVYLTGHSMGGAIAVIAALYLSNKQYKNLHVITFGAPRVFNVSGSKFYDSVLGQKTLRVVQNNRDPVTAVGLEVCDFRHVGQQLNVPLVILQYTPSYGMYYFNVMHSIHRIDSYRNAIQSVPDRSFVLCDTISSAGLQALFLSFVQNYTYIDTMVNGGASLVRLLLDPLYPPQPTKRINNKDVGSSQRTVTQECTNQDTVDNVKSISQIRLERCEAIRDTNEYSAVGYC